MLGLSLRKWREQENVPPLKSATDSKGSYDHFTTKQSAPATTGGVLSILTIVREDTKTTDVLALGGRNGSSGRCFDQASR